MVEFDRPAIDRPGQPWRVESSTLNGSTTALCAEALRLSLFKNPVPPAPRFFFYSLCHLCHLIAVSLLGLVSLLLCCTSLPTYLYTSLSHQPSHIYTSSIAYQQWPPPVPPHCVLCVCSRSRTQCPPPCVEAYTLPVPTPHSPPMSRQRAPCTRVGI